MIDAIFIGFSAGVAKVIIDMCTERKHEEIYDALNNEIQQENQAEVFFKLLKHANALSNRALKIVDLDTPNQDINDFKSNKNDTILEVVMPIAESVIEKILAITYCIAIALLTGWTAVTSIGYFHCRF